MIEKEKDSSVSNSSFKEIITRFVSDKPLVRGDVYVGSSFGIAFGLPPFFKPIFEKSNLVRLNVMRVLIVKSGWCEPVINFKRYRCEAGDMLFLNWGVVISDDSFGPGTTFDGFIMTEEYMKMIFHGRLPNVFLSPSFCFSIPLQKSDQDIWEKYIRMLYELAQMKSDGIKDSLNALFASSLSFAASLYQTTMSIDKARWTRNKELVEHFIRLVDEHAKTEHELNFYASKLCVSTHYLGIVVKQETGKTAKNIIDKSLLVLIQLELRYSNKPLKVIADELNFVSISALCKFFKRCTGLTTAAYREMSDTQLSGELSSDISERNLD